MNKIEKFYESVIIDDVQFSEDKKCRKIIATLIASGENKSGERVYSDSVLKEAVDKGLFNGVKNFSSHTKERDDRGTQSIKDWLSTITRSWFEDGKVKGEIIPHDSWLSERLSDNVAREQLGLSIVASGSMRKKDVVNLKTIESVDWVSNPGAGGKVDYIVENREGGGDNVNIAEITLKELQEGRKDLINEVEKPLLEKITGLETKIKEAETKIKEVERKEKLQKIITENKIEDAVRERVIKICENTKTFQEENFEAKVKEIIEEENKYFAKITEAGKVKDAGKSETRTQENKTLKESFERNLKNFQVRLGIG